jgi:hypothetical protein
MREFCKTDGTMAANQVRNESGTVGRMIEVCPGCGAQLPVVNGFTHRYIGASASCWVLYSALNVGEPAVTAGPLRALLVDAYAAQHPGVPSNQSIQSVAVHLLTLYAVLERSASVGALYRLRTQALRPGRSSKHDRFVWLEPPPLAALGAVTVADIVHTPAPAARGAVADDYVRSIWGAWHATHGAQIATWYECFVVPDRL